MASQSNQQTFAEKAGLWLKVQKQQQQQQQRQQHPVEQQHYEQIDQKPQQQQLAVCDPMKVMTFAEKAELWFKTQHSQLQQKHDQQYSQEHQQKQQQQNKVQTPDSIRQGPIQTPGMTGHGSIQTPDLTGQVPIQTPGLIGQGSIQTPDPTGQGPIQTPDPTGQGPIQTPGLTEQSPIQTPGLTGQGLISANKVSLSQTPDAHGQGRLSAHVTPGQAVSKDHFQQHPQQHTGEAEKQPRDSLLDLPQSSLEPDVMSIAPSVPHLQKRTRLTKTSSTIFAYNAAEAPVRQDINDGSHQEYRLLLDKIAEELTHGEVDDLVFLLRFLIEGKRNRISINGDSRKLFTKLQKQNYIGVHNLTLLLEVFNLIGRVDLIQEIERHGYITSENCQISPFIRDLWNFGQKLGSEDLKKSVFSLGWDKEKEEIQKVWQLFEKAFEKGNLEKDEYNKFKQFADTIGQTKTLESVMENGAKKNIQGYQNIHDSHKEILDNEAYLSIKKPTQIVSGQTFIDTGSNMTLAQKPFFADKTKLAMIVQKMQRDQHVLSRRDHIIYPEFGDVPYQSHSDDLLYHDTKFDDGRDHTQSQLQLISVPSPDELSISQSVALPDPDIHTVKLALPSKIPENHTQPNTNTSLIKAFEDFPREGERSDSQKEPGEEIHLAGRISNQNLSSNMVDIAWNSDKSGYDGDKRDGQDADVTGKDKITPLNAVEKEKHEEDETKQWSVETKERLTQQEFDKYVLEPIKTLATFEEQKIVIPKNPRCGRIISLKVEEMTKCIGEEIGRGSFGIVYKAKMTAEDDRKFAIKSINVTNEVFQKSYEKEISSGRILHPFINPIIARAEDLSKSVVYLMYPYMENLHLRHNIDLEKAGKKLDTKGDESNSRIWTRCIYQIANAVDYIHKPVNSSFRGPIFHQDLTSHNIFLDEHFNVKIGDFGMAVEAKKDAPSATLSRIKQPREYHPPEMNQLKYTASYDIFSVGVVMLEILTGENAKLKGKPEYLYEKYVCQGGDRDLIEDLDKRTTESAKWIDKERRDALAKLALEAVDQNDDKRERFNLLQKLDEMQLSPQERYQWPSNLDRCVSCYINSLGENCFKSNLADI